MSGVISEKKSSWRNLCESVLFASGVFASLLFLLSSCVGGQTVEDRIRDSRSLSAPTFQETLGDDQNFSFMVTGDTHVNSLDATHFRAILQDGISRGNEFFIVLGDVVDRGQWQNYDVINTALSDFGFTSRFFPVLGNHDIFVDSWQHFRDHYGPNYYTFDAGNSRFIVLDTADGSLGKTQWEWFEKVLDEPQPTNTFVVTHYMPIVPNITTYLKISDHEEASRFMSLCIRKKVRAVMGGHYHSYKRQNIGGTEFVVAGCADGRRMPPQFGRGYVEVTVRGSQVTYESQVLNY